MKPAIERAQARGKVLLGNVRLCAFSIVGPILAAIIFREVFRDAGAQLSDLNELAALHADTVPEGLMLPGAAGMNPSPKTLRRVKALR